jgi:hypothetical protein
MAISKDLEETFSDVTETSGFVLTSILTAHFLTLLRAILPIREVGAGMEPAGAERHRRRPEGKLAGTSESIEPARRKKASSSNETERNIEAGAGIEPANRFTDGEAILLQ